MSDKKRNDELFSLKELKSLLKKLDTEFWLKFFIPVVFLVGVIRQVIILSMYGALAFFSWGQVIPDAIIFIIPLLAFFCGYYIDANFSLTKDNKLTSFLIAFLLYFLGIYYIGEYFNVYIAIILAFFSLGYMTVSLFSFGKVIGSKLDEKLFNNKKPKKFLKVTIFILLYILIILMFAILLTLITLEHKLLYKDVKMEVNGIIEEVNYISDKYIIYGDGNVISNDGTVKFILKGKEKQEGKNEKNPCKKLK